jgi:hypothetical protein
MLVAVFETGSSGFEDLDALRQLHGSGDITLYASAVVVKDEAGKFEVKQTADQGPVGTAVGLVTGKLLGGKCLLGQCPGLVQLFRAHFEIRLDVGSPFSMRRFAQSLASFAWSRSDAILASVSALT